ncbi:MAG: hypothetical protein C4523_00455 [Myxococcales bacterium]|nr:MAG: hypothetical protein C4523_00455 [Myxococcales bacterium]
MPRPSLPVLLFALAVCGLLIACGDGSSGAVPDEQSDDDDDAWTLENDDDFPSEAPPDGDLDKPDHPDMEESDPPELDGDDESEPASDEAMPDGDEDSPAEIEPAEEFAEEEPEPLPCIDLMRRWQTVAEGEFGPTDWVYEGNLADRCQADGLLIAGAKGMTVSVTLMPKGLAQPLVGRMFMAEAAAASGRREAAVYYDASDTFPLHGLSHTFTLPYSGEYLIVVSGAGEMGRAGDYTLTAHCSDGCDKLFTRFPIAMLHGMAGWDSVLEIYDYFRGVKDDLIGRGYDVHVTEVAMFNNTDYRAAEIESQLLDILWNTGARKLDLVAHSQGGIDARHFISGMGHENDVALLAMLSTPNRGVILGDMILGNVTGVSQEILAGLFDFFGNLIDGSESDIRAALAQIAVKNMTEVFNPAHPDAPGVLYWSWAGTTCLDLDFSCQDAHGGEWVNPVFALPYRLVAAYAPSPEFAECDGLVPVESAKWGEFFGTVNADHPDEIGQLKTGGFDHIALYADIASRIHAAGR